MKIEEGFRYNFKVDKQIEFDNNNFWVLIAPDSKRYLLSCDDYSQYNIQIGEERECRVDKINCKGEVFLEPLHPCYREGSSYLFTALDFDRRIDKDGISKDVIILGDDYKNEIVVALDYFEAELPSLNESISLRIDQIVKGSIIISGPSKSKHGDKEEESDLIDFLLKGESVAVDGRLYYIIEDNVGRRHTIPKDYYKHYGFKVNKTFRGRYLRYKEGQGINIEPLSPFFEPGNDYEFTVKEFLQLTEGMDDIMVIVDEYGYDHKLKAISDYKKGQSVRYRVVKMRKGWPLLEPM